MCGIGAATVDWPDTGEAGLFCCYGSAEYGPERCTCWTPVYDVVQQRPRVDEPSGAMPRMCGDCAFRPNSPERNGHPGVRGDWDELQSLVYSDTPFWCHDGFRLPVAWFHPPSLTWLLVVEDIAYDPLLLREPHGIPTPYRHDGRPGDLCAGWTAMRLHREYRGAQAVTV